MFVHYQNIKILFLLIFDKKFAKLYIILAAFNLHEIAQSGTRNNGRSEFPMSDNKIWDKYEVVKLDYEVLNMK